LLALGVVRVTKILVGLVLINHYKNSINYCKAMVRIIAQFKVSQLYKALVNFL